MKNTKQLGIVLTIIMIIGSCNGQPPQSEAPIMPILEGVLRPGVSPSYVPRNSGGEYEVLPSSSVFIRLSNKYPGGSSSMIIDIDGIPIEWVRADNRPRQRDLDEQNLGYYFIQISANPYYDLIVVPPVSARHGSGFTIGIVNLALNPPPGINPQSERLTIRVMSVGTKLMTEPSDVFFFDPGAPDPKPGTDFHPLNQKPAASIVAKNVILRGWLVKNREDDPNSQAVEANVIDIGAEDIHYHLRLDPDFIASQYGNNTSPELRNAILHGHPTDSSPQIPLIDIAPDGTERGITVNSFWLPNSGTSPLAMVIELNAWHTTSSKKGGSLAGLYNNYQGRGVAPAGWIEKEYPISGSTVPHPDAADSWWPYDPDNPDNSRDRNGVPLALKEGDYVEVKGTLWEDAAHGAEGSCWDKTFKNHAAWLEIHPPDSIRRVMPPSSPPKTVVTISLCTDTNQAAKHNLLVCPEGIGEPRGGPVTSLKPHVEELIDGRFTNITTIDAFNENDCVRIEAKLLGTSPPEYLKATYIVWWE